MRFPRWPLVCSVLLALGCAPSSLVGVPGLESAAVFGVVLPFLFAAGQAHRTASARRDGEHDVATAVGHALVLPSFAMLCVVAIQLARHLVDPSCATFSALPRLVLGPWPGMVLAALVGELVGRVVDRPRRAAFVAVTAVLAAYGVVVYELACTPAVFVFSIFGGHWPGPIYDDVVGFPTSLLTYRCVTLLAIVALGLALRFGPRAPSPFHFRGLALVVALACAAAFAALTVRGADLGHRTSVARIDRELGAKVRGARCVVHLPSEVPAFERRRTLAECEAHVRGIERLLGVRRARPVDVFVYRSAAEKGALVGAAETYVAKPWRGEVHVQREAFPHTVLRHELVHVIAAEFGARPLGVSGRLGGLVMNPGLVEGLAVAAADEGRDGLTAHQWSRAMLELGQLPSVTALTGTGFLGQGANASYQSAGSFVGFLLQTRGARAVAAMYARGTVGDPATIARLERSWHAYLRTVELPPSALELARTRLLDRGLFSTRCARLREQLGHDLAEARERGDDGRALRTCARLVRIDPRDAGARIAEIQALARAGRIEDAKRRLERVAAARIAPVLLMARVHQTLGDAMVARAADHDAFAFAAARRRYEAAAAVPQDEATLRSLEVRLQAIGFAPPTRRIVLHAIIERDRASASEAAVVAALLTVEDPEARAVARYLAARRLLGGPPDPRVRALLVEARTLGLATDRLRRETDRLLALESTRLAFEDLRRADARREAEQRWMSLATDAITASESQRVLTLLRELPAPR